MMEALGFFANQIAGFFIWAVETIKDEPGWLCWLAGVIGSIYMATDSMLDILLQFKKEYRKQVKVRRG